MFRLHTVAKLLNVTLLSRETSSLMSPVLGHAGERHLSLLSEPATAEASTISCGPLSPSLKRHRALDAGTASRL